MVLQPALRETRRFGRAALTTLLIGIGGAAIATLPLGDSAFAGNGNGNGGGHGHDGGHGGGNSGGHGGGNGGGHGGGNGGGNGNGAGGKGSGQGAGGKSQSRSHDGSGKSAKTGRPGDDGTMAADSTGDDMSASDDQSMSPHNLGKLNGFFHASSTALAQASPNSAIGRISHGFKSAVSDFAKANNTEQDPDNANAAPPAGPSVDDLGGILARATNKTVTATQVKAIIDRLAEQNPADQSLNDFAASVDNATVQDIADAANAAQSGEAPDDAADDDSADSDAGSTPDGSTPDGSDDSAGDDGTVAATAAN
jgi:hypothetical protein